MQITRVRERMLEKKLKGCIVFTPQRRVSTDAVFSFVQGDEILHFRVSMSDSVGEMRASAIAYPSPVASSFCDKRRSWTRWRFKNLR